MTSFNKILSKNSQSQEKLKNTYLNLVKKLLQLAHNNLDILAMHPVPTNSLLQQVQAPQKQYLKSVLGLVILYEQFGGEMEKYDSREYWKNHCLVLVLL